MVRVKERLRWTTWESKRLALDVFGAKVVPGREYLQGISLATPTPHEHPDVCFATPYMAIVKAGIYRYCLFQPKLSGESLP